MYADSASSRSIFTLARRPRSVFIVVSTPRQPTTVVMPAVTISLIQISGLWREKPPSPPPLSRCSCGSMNPGTTTQRRASITSSSNPAASIARASASPTRTILPSTSSTGRRPQGVGEYTSPFSISVSITSHGWWSAGTPGADRGARYAGAPPLCGDPRRITRPKCHSANVFRRSCWAIRPSADRSLRATLRESCPAAPPARAAASAGRR